MPTNKDNLEITQIYVPETVSVNCQVRCTDCGHLFYENVMQVRKRYTVDDFHTEVSKVFDRIEFNNHGICPHCYSANSTASHSIAHVENNSPEYNKLVVKKSPITD